jgi:hypothetical protein
VPDTVLCSTYVSTLWVKGRVSRDLLVIVATQVIVAQGIRDLHNLPVPSVFETDKQQNKMFLLIMP